MRQLVFTMSMIVEGATENVSQFDKPLKSVYNKNVCFDKQYLCF